MDGHGHPAGAGLGLRRPRPGAAVEAARRVDDTVVVFLHWGVELDACPDPLQEPLANVLVQAGADIVIGSHAHVLLGGGYLGSAYVDYGLGNFAFYNTPPPTDQSGSLVITATGRHIDNVTWRPALIEDELPVPLTGDDATQALQSWAAARTCTDLSPDGRAPRRPPPAPRRSRHRRPPSPSCRSTAEPLTVRPRSPLRDRSDRAAAAAADGPGRRPT